MSLHLSAAFSDISADLLDTIANAPSGRELIDLGFSGDVQYAAQWDVSTCVPRLTDGSFNPV